MCGIYGSFNSDPKIKNFILNKLSHRGPDGSGYYINENKDTFLCHTRLSIIDESNNGLQPMTDETENYLITFNGEIYNFMEIKKKLLSKGHKFKSNSDTEVVLHSYIEWGAKCLDIFRGMFAFCIYQKNNSKFFLARDRFGIKPLIYFYDGSKFYFSSEMKTFFQNEEIRKTLDEKAIFDYFSYGSICQPNTIFKEFKYLLPGHYLIFDSKNNFQIQKYYDLEKVIKKKKIIDNKSEIFFTLDEKLKEVSKYNAVSDVEISAFLSGGIDSTTAVYLMQKISNKPVSTYHVLFEDFKGILDESSLSKKIAKSIGTNHKTLNINSKNIEKSFDTFISCIDQPSIDGFNTFIISKEVSKFHKVAISGIGGDEVFGGYNFYNNIYKYSNIKKNVFDKTLSYFNKLRPNRFTNHYQLKNQIPEKSILEFRKINRDINFFNSNLQNDFFLNDDKSNLTTLQRISLFEIKNYLNNTLLRDSDINSMANSIEIRPIFLDHELIEFALSIPDDYKIYKNTQKKILVDYLKGLVPNEVFESKKYGFEFPYINWMNGVLNQKFNDLICNKDIRVFIEFYFDKEHLRNLEIRAYKKNLKEYDWSIFIFIYWYYKNLL